VAVKLLIDNWRWSGVPFYLRTGKALPLSASEVRIQFRPTPHVLFAAQCGPKLDANALTLRLQPTKGSHFGLMGKFGDQACKCSVRMNFSYNSEFGAYTPEAYERLLLEAMAGDATLFIRRDEVETAWKIVDSMGAPTISSSAATRYTWACAGSCSLGRAASPLDRPLDPPDHCHRRLRLRTAYRQLARPPDRSTETTSVGAGDVFHDADHRGEDLPTDYQIASGRLCDLPYVHRLHVEGLEPQEISDLIRKRLIEGKILIDQRSSFASASTTASTS